jgi:iron complex transport system substrate-binding protein
VINIGFIKSLSKSKGGFILLNKKNYIAVLVMALVLILSISVMAETRVVEHAMGKTEIEGTPQRVVTLYQGASDAAHALDIPLVGIVESWVEKPVYKYLRDDLSDVKQVGLETQPNLEEISKLNPDLIIASKMRHEDIYNLLSQIAPTVMEENVFRYRETVKLMGKAAGREEKAAEVLNNWDQRAADFREKIEAKMGEKWPIEVAVLNFRADHARIYYSGYAGRILNELGFERPEDHKKDTWGVKLTSKESIPEMNAEAFFIFMSDDQAVENTYQEWTEHPLWQNLDAVQNEQVFRVDQVAWNMAGGIESAHIMLDQLYEHFELEE